MIRRHWLKRRWYAEDIALAMEMINEGIPMSAVAIAYGTSVENLGHQMTKARKHGYKAFPPQSSVKVRRILKPPAVSGNYAQEFLRTLSLRA